MCESSPLVNISDRESERREESCERSERDVDNDAPFVFCFLCHSCVLFLSEGTLSRPPVIQR